MKKNAEFVGVEDVRVAKIIQDDENAYACEVPRWFAPVAEISGEPSVENKTTSYDNVPKNNYVTEGATPLTMVFSGVSAEQYAEYLGKYYDSDTGRVYDTGKPEPPECAVSFKFNKGQSDFRYYQYLKGTFSGGAEEAKTKEEGKTEVKTYTMIFTAITTVHKWMINGKMQALKRIFGETTDENFNEQGWIDAVQTPDTAVAAIALAVESSVPADEAAGIAVDAPITVTFNNKLTIMSASLLTDAFAGVEATITSDASGKVYTITPDEDLVAATNYNLVIAEAVDVYGKKLNNVVINFTTA